MYAYVFKYVCVFVKGICMYVLYVCMYVCMYVCTYVCVYLNEICPGENTFDGVFEDSIERKHFRQSLRYEPNESFGNVCTYVQYMYV